MLDATSVDGTKQHNFPHEPARFFFMDATRSGLPVDVLHAFRDRAATMRVRLASLVPLVNAGGPDLTRAETVTLLNDLCLLAPAALLDPAIGWEAIDDRFGVVCIAGAIVLVRACPPESV